MHEEIAHIPIAYAESDELPLESYEQSRKLSKMELLFELGWSPLRDVRKLQKHSKERITEIESIPAENWGGRAVATAYYALELADSSLKSPRTAGFELSKISSPPGVERTAADQQIIDDFLKASVLETVLGEIFGTYYGNYTLEHAVKSTTKEFSSENNGSLKALRKMLNAEDYHHRISAADGRRAEIVLRGAMATWQEEKKKREKSDNVE